MGAIMMALFIAVFETATFFAKRIDRTRRRKKEEPLDNFQRLNLPFS
jgi:hypothetical protein